MFKIPYFGVAWQRAISIIADLVDGFGTMLA